MTSKNTSNDTQNNNVMQGGKTDLSQNFPSPSSSTCTDIIVSPPKMNIFGFVSPLSEFSRALRNTAVAPQSLAGFPDETLLHVLAYLDGEALFRVKQVSRCMNELAKRDDFWAHLCQTQWGINLQSVNILSQHPLMKQFQRDSTPSEKFNSPEIPSSQQLYFIAWRTMRKITQDILHEQCLRSVQTTFQIPRQTAISIMEQCI